MPALPFFRSTALDDAGDIGGDESVEWPELQPFLPHQDPLQDLNSNNLDTNIVGTSDIAAGEDLLLPSPYTTGFQQDSPSEPIGPLADEQGDATQPSSATTDGTDYIIQEQTSAIVPTERTIAQCNFLNDFVFDARRLRGLPH